MSEQTGYFSNRCGMSFEVSRDTWRMCALPIGHEGAHLPAPLPKQTVSDQQSRERAEDVIRNAIGYGLPYREKAQKALAALLAEKERLEEERDEAYATGHRIEAEKEQAQLDRTEALAKLYDVLAEKERVAERLHRYRLHAEGDAENQRALLTANELLGEALRFYANEGNWIDHEVVGSIYELPEPWAIARAALAGDAEGENE